MDRRLGKFLHRESPGPLPTADQDWNDLTEREQAQVVEFASRIVDETLTALIELAESPTMGFQDVAPHAMYWLIELQARQSGELPDLGDGMDIPLAEQFREDFPGVQ